MKKVEAIIKPFKLDDVKEALNAIGIQGMTVSEVKGYGRQKSYLDQYEGSEYSLAYLPKVEISLWVDELRVDEVLHAYGGSAVADKDDDFLPGIVDGCTDAGGQGHRPAVDALLVIDERLGGQPAGLHHELLTVAGAAGLGDVFAVHGGLGIVGSEDRVARMAGVTRRRRLAGRDGAAVHALLVLRVLIDTLLRRVLVHQVGVAVAASAQCGHGRTGDLAHKTARAAHGGGRVGGQRDARGAVADDADHDVHRQPGLCGRRHHRGLAGHFLEIMGREPHHPTEHEEGLGQPRVEAQVGDEPRPVLPERALQPDRQ